MHLRLNQIHLAFVWFCYAVTSFEFIFFRYCSSIIFDSRTRENKTGNQRDPLIFKFVEFSHCLLLSIVSVFSKPFLQHFSSKQTALYTFLFVISALRGNKIILCHAGLDCYSVCSSVDMGVH